MSSYVSMTVDVHHADGSPHDIAAKVSAAVMSVLTQDSEYLPFPMTVEVRIDEHTGECSQNYCGHDAAEGVR